MDWIIGIFILFWSVAFLIVLLSAAMVFFHLTNDIRISEGKNPRKMKIPGLKQLDDWMGR